MLLIVSNRFCEYASLLFILSALPSIFSPFTILLYAALDRWFRFSLLRALELFDMLLPSHLARRATCYLGDSNIHFCPGSRCLPLLLCVPPHCFSNSLTYVARAAPILLPTPLPLSFSRLFVLSLSLLSSPLSLSPSPSAESHSGSLDQTLQRSRQRKVLPGAQLTYLLCSCRLGQPRVSDTSFLLTAQHYFPKTFGNTLRRDSVFLEMLSNL